MIHRFRVQNFKSIVNVDVDLSPVTVLVGKSGTGKSSFVQALRFLRAMRSCRSKSLSNRGLNYDPWRRREHQRPSMSEFSVAGIDENFSRAGDQEAGQGSAPRVARLRSASAFPRPNPGQTSLGG